MADITMCDGKNCKLKEKCYRHTAIADKWWQPVFLKAPVKDGKCEMFWSNKK